MKTRSCVLLALSLGLANVLSAEALYDLTDLGTLEGGIAVGPILTISDR